MKCGNCGHWEMGIPTGKCNYPRAILLFTSDKMVSEDASKECPITNKEHRGLREIKLDIEIDSLVNEMIGRNLYGR